MSSFIMILLFSCETTITQSTLPDKIDGSLVRIYEIDSCEYIYIINDIKSLTHKGNCKYCKSRRLNNQ